MVDRQQRAVIIELVGLYGAHYNIDNSAVPRVAQALHDEQRIDGLA